MNEVIPGDDRFYISYLPQPDEFATALDEICATMGRPPPTGQPETALVVRDQGRNQYTGHAYYILYGDHRKAYAELIPDLDKCLKYFQDNINLIGHSSDLPPVTRN